MTSFKLDIPPERVSKWSLWCFNTKYTGKTQTNQPLAELSWQKRPYIQLYPGGWAESSFFNGCRVQECQMLFVTRKLCNTLGYLVNNRVVKSTCCSARGSGFYFQHSSSKENHLTHFFWPPWAPGTHVVYIQIYRQNTHTHQKKLK